MSIKDCRETWFEIKKRIRALSWHNASWLFLCSESSDLSIVKREWKWTCSFIVEIGITGLTYAHEDAAKIVMSVSTSFDDVDNLFAEALRKFFKESPPVGQIDSGNRVVVHHIETYPDTIGNFEKKVMRPIINFFDAYGKLANEFTRIICEEYQDFAAGLYEDDYYKEDSQIAGGSTTT